MTEKGTRYNVRVSPSEKRKIKRAAKAEKIPLSTWIRSKLLIAADKVLSR